ncbi:MAG: ABC transporter ATP-binding protein [Pseudomonas sp.]|nr:ABC transporter ATP-binding protein [Pseudomonas sp.]
MCSDLAVSLQGVSKHYPIYPSPVRRMLSLLFNRNFGTPKIIRALQDVSLTIAKGETVAIIGRNGSGKSTLLQVLCGILQPTAGSVQVQGRVAALLELGAGFSPEFTGRENVFMSAAVYGLSREQIEQKMPDILAFAEIDEFIDQPVKTYSSGMFVRLAFAVIAHVDADILVIDEALAVGDAYFTQKCMRFLRAFKQQGTLIFVSHDTHSVITLCDRALWLEKGHTQMLGGAKEVSEAYIASLYAQDAAQADGGEHRQGEFGSGKVEITRCRLLDDADKELRLLEHAQTVVLEVHCRALEAIELPILGFFVRDRLGQPLFGENSIAWADDWQQMQAGGQYCLRFSFIMPLLATGEYTLGVAIGSGTQMQHTQHHWIYEAYAFKAQASPHLTGFMALNEVSFAAQSVADKA